MHIADDQFKDVAKRLLDATPRITVFGHFDPEGGMKHVDVRLHRAEAADMNEWDGIAEELCRARDR